MVLPIPIIDCYLLFGCEPSKDEGEVSCPLFSIYYEWLVRGVALALKMGQGNGPRVHES